MTQTDEHFATIAQIVAPQGRTALIDDPGMIDVRLLKQKSVSLRWEWMFTRPMVQTPEMIRQHELLNEVADHVDNERLRTTVRERVAAISAENLLQAHPFRSTADKDLMIFLKPFWRRNLDARFRSLDRYT